MENWQIEDESRILVFKFVCSMNDKHYLDYIVSTEENKFRKIGQYPSVADLTFPELNEYKKVMSEDDRKEFRRAIGYMQVELVPAPMFIFEGFSKACLNRQKERLEMR